MPKNIVIVGAGGFASEVFHWATRNDYKVKFFIDETASVRKLCDVKVIHKLVNSPRNCDFIVAIGDPGVRSRLFSKALQIGLNPLGMITDPSSITGNAVVGHGTILCPHVVLTHDVVCGHGVILNLNSTVGHGARIGDFVTVSPGAHISGNVSIGPYSYIGTGAVIREGVSIPPNTVIGMGSVVVKSITESGVYAGCPAVRIK